MATVCAPDYTRLQKLVLSMHNSYECDQQLSTLWAHVGAALTDLDLRVSSYENSRRHARGEIVGDGLDNLHQLREKNLPLQRVSLSRLPIRAFVVAHRLLVEPLNGSLCAVELRHCHCWPLLVARLADAPALREIRIEHCRIEAPDVAPIVRSAGARLASFWANIGHWTSPQQIDALRACTQIAKLDLYCKYEDAYRDVRAICGAHAPAIREVRVGGPGFTGTHVLDVVKTLPHLRRISVCGVPLKREAVDKLLQIIGERMESLFFDTVEGDWHAGDLLVLVRTKARAIHQLGFPSKLRSRIPAPQDLSYHEKERFRVAVCMQLLDEMESLPHLDIDALRESLISGLL